MFRSVIQIGMLLQRTLADIEHLERDVATWIMVHNLNEELSSSRSEDNGKGYSKTLLLEIEPKIKKIDLQIKALNKISTLLATKSKVTLVKRAEIHRLVKARFSTVAASDAINLNNENFNLKLSHLLRGIRQSIGSYIESLDAIKRFDGLDKS